MRLILRWFGLKLAEWVVVRLARNQATQRQQAVIHGILFDALMWNISAELPGCYCFHADRLFPSVMGLFTAHIFPPVFSLFIPFRGKECRGLPRRVRTAYSQTLCLPHPKVGKPLPYPGQNLGRTAGTRAFQLSQWISFWLPL